MTKLSDAIKNLEASLAMDPDEDVTLSWALACPLLRLADEYATSTAKGRKDASERLLRASVKANKLRERKEK